MDRIANFEKVSFEQFFKDLDWHESSMPYAQLMYDNIQLPERSTAGSAGYDFYAPTRIILNPSEEYLIQTGIRCKMNEGWVLMLFPRSGLGFKYGMQLLNTVGIIDSDFYHAENEGHIMVKIKNPSDKVLVLNAGDKFCQGVFLPFGITDFDNATAKRTGGFGSTGK